MKCLVCSKAVSLAYAEPIRSQLVERQLCFTCNFWYDLVLTKDDPTHFVINGNHFTVLPEKAGGMRGYGGRAFTIHCQRTNKTFRTTNLWHQGAIPPEFVSQLPNNATFK